ncbi:hypothetical protein WA026_012261 [Henosepilachna vigintioctopunctata]|uniref:Protein TsetseEP domain-containing protein n=1 Tax=Henosepilachna vigintioctopunctata TaxID=420089 RepID=A0AAW1V898_9CUCU
MPSSSQQKNMINIGKELCNYLKEVVSTEAQESENAIQKDVDLMIQNSKKQLNLIEKNFNLKISCSNNNENSRGFSESVPEMVRNADISLSECGIVAGQQASIIADRIRTDAAKLERKGLEMMDAFLDCSRKTSWSMFACYKKVVGANMGPMKDFVTDTVRAHSGAHTDFLILRRNVAECIQTKLEEFKTKIETLYFYQ